jgi:anti-sigma B factor antagonist
MKYSIDKNEQYNIFVFEDDRIDSVAAPKLKTEFITLFQSGAQSLILDLSKVRYVDSSGLSALLVANRLAGEADSFFVLTNVNDHVMKLLSMTKLDAVFNILTNIPEAIEAILESLEAKEQLSEEESTEE